MIFGGNYSNFSKSWIAWLVCSVLSLRLIVNNPNGKNDTWFKPNSIFKSIIHSLVSVWLYGGVRINLIPAAPLTHHCVIKLCFIWANTRFKINYSKFNLSFSTITPRESTDSHHSSVPGYLYCFSVKFNDHFGSSLCLLISKQTSLIPLITVYVQAWVHV